MTAHNVIWLDSTPERQQALAEAFGSEGDWFKSDKSTLESVHAVLVHATDAKLKWEDSDIQSDPDTNIPKDRLIAFRLAVRNIALTPNPPLLIVYTGDKKEQDKLDIGYNFNRNITVYPSNRFRIALEVGREVNAEDMEGVLNTQLEFSTQEIADDATAKKKERKKVMSAIELVAEVVAWLELNKAQKFQLDEMERLRLRLQNKFGLDGERLVKELMDKVGADKLNDVTSTVEKMKIDRIQDWKRAGMFATIKDKGEN